MTSNAEQQNCINISFTDWVQGNIYLQSSHRNTKNIYTKKCFPNNWRTHTKIYFLYFLTAAILCLLSFAFSFNIDLQGLLCFQQSLCNAFNFAFILCRHLFFFFPFLPSHNCLPITHTHTYTYTHSFHFLIFTILFYTWDYFNNCLVDGYLRNHNLHVFCATATSTAINLSLILSYNTCILILS